MEGKRWKQRDTKIWSELGYEESWGSRVGVDIGKPKKEMITQLNRREIDNSIPSSSPVN